MDHPRPQTNLQQSIKKFKFFFVIFLYPKTEILKFLHFMEQPEILNKKILTFMHYFKTKILVHSTKKSIFLYIP